MSICPKCKKEINELSYSKIKEINGSVSLDSNDELEFDEEYNIIEEQKEFNFSCPECDVVLFTDDEEAEDFLKNDELQQIVKEKIEQIKEFSLKK